MSLDLPPIIAALNRAQNHRDAEAFADCFAGDGVVEDQPEEVVIEGRDAIKNWAAEIAKFNLLVEPVTFQSGTKESTLTCRVSGDFPGSPILFDYRFHLTGELIQRLVINLSAGDGDSMFGIPVVTFDGS
ncbi:MAG: hypothetical protein QOD99_1938 [Chthoniobacter sp.]|nr:hypothetical protein [Chthoniobacter sp.]